VLHRIVVCCSVLQYVAVRCSVFHSSSKSHVQVTSQFTCTSTSEVVTNKFVIPSSSSHTYLEPFHLNMNKVFTLHSANFHVHLYQRSSRTSSWHLPFDVHTSGLSHLYMNKVCIYIRSSPSVQPMYIYIRSRHEQVRDPIGLWHIHTLGTRF